MNNLRNIRKARGLSLKKLHEITGIPVKSLEAWDCETRQITEYHRIKLLSEVLECDTDILMLKEENCVYGGVSAVIWLVQKEEGVSIEIMESENLEELFKIVIPREKALELLKYMKTDKEIKPFLAEIEQN